jgi:hypothetical protein
VQAKAGVEAQAAGQGGSLIVPMAEPMRQAG